MNHIEEISNLVDDVSPMLTKEQLTGGMATMVRKIKFLHHEDVEEWVDCMVDKYEGKTEYWTPDWVHDDAGLVMRAGRILLLAVAKELETENYGHSWIYKMERGSRRICPFYRDRLYKDLKDTVEQLQEDE